MAGGALGDDSRDDVGRNRGPASRARRWLHPGSSGPALFRNQALELVDGNEPGAPRHLDRLDQWQDASVEGRAADSKGSGSLRPGIGQPLDTGRLAGDLKRWGWRSVERLCVSLCFLGLAPETAA